jgi:UDP-2,4-diacetamido-2,4,6-trideoxy-beta-L-altropyranose hydrolase
MNPGTLLIRADASIATGSGHVMRCLALAQGWQDAGGAVVFAVAEVPGAIERRLIAENIAVIKLPGNTGASEEISAVAMAVQHRNTPWVVIDGEGFSVEYIDAWKKHDFRVLLLDDFGTARAQLVDLVLNQNLEVSRETYPWHRDDPRLLLGTKYILLRREFGRVKPRVTSKEIATRMLITFGGSDPDGLTEKVLEVVETEMANLSVTAVIGSANARALALQQKASSPGVTVLVDPPNLPELMVESDLAVIIAGGTLWELLHCGCAILSYARNSLQRGMISKLAQAGAVWDLGPVTQFAAEDMRIAIRKVAGSYALRERMCATGRSIVDADGAARVVRRMLEA